MRAAMEASQPRANPPASARAIAALKSWEVSADSMLSDPCAVCQDAFEPGNEVSQIGCGHIFHKDCLLPWLQNTNTCPTCRYEVETIDASYNERKQVRPAPSISPCGFGQIHQQECTLLEQDGQLVSLDCGCVFHRECLVAWMHEVGGVVRCPMCRRDCNWSPATATAACPATCAHTCAAPCTDDMDCDPVHPVNPDDIDLDLALDEAVAAATKGCEA